MIKFDVDYQSIVSTIESMTRFTRSQIVPMVNRTSSQVLLEEVRGTIKSTFPRGTGALRKSFYAGGDPEKGMYVASDSPYARIQDQGGTIKARRGKYLAIPLKESLRGRSPRGMNLFFIVSRAGHRLLVSKSGKNIDPNFLLKESVHLTARHYIKRAVDESPARIYSELGKLLAGKKHSF